MSDLNRDMVICSKCLWAASLLRGSQGYSTCPVCGASSLDTIPVEDHESYTMAIRNQSVEIEFSKE